MANLPTITLGDELKLALLREGKKRPQSGFGVEYWPALSVKGRCNSSAYAGSGLSRFEIEHTCSIFVPTHLNRW